MRIEKCEAFLSEGGWPYKTEADAIRATYRERLDFWAQTNLLNPVTEPNGVKAYETLYRHLDAISELLQGYPPRHPKA